MANENISFRIKAKDDYTKTLSRLDRNLGKARKNIQSFGKGMAGVGTMMTKMVTAPILGVGATVATMGQAFEKSMSDVEAVTQASAKEMEEMEDVARELGKTTPKSAKEAAEGMTYLGKAQTFGPVIEKSVA